MLKLILIAPFLFAVAAAPALADLNLRFDEGAPKDRFTLTNVGECPLPAMQVTLDLGTAPSGLVFDVTANGAGVEVFQPFEIVAGAEFLDSVPAVKDGDSAIVLEISDLAVAQTVAFTIDVDDTNGGREIIISGSEIAGATVHTVLAGKTTRATFSDAALAIVPLSACRS